MRNKKSLIFALIIVCIILGTIIGICINKNNKIYTLENITNIDYMLFMQNNKYGIINKNGDILVQAIYDEINIPNPSKPVFICMNNFNIEKNQYNVTVLNEKGEQILYQYYYLEAIKLDWSTSEIPFEKSVLKYKKDGKFGLIDLEGNIITKAKYEEISGLPNQEGLLLVKKSGKYGVINIKGDYILKEKYDIIMANANYLYIQDQEKSGFIVGLQNKNKYKYGYVNCNGNKILKTEYEQIEPINNSSNNNPYYIVFQNGQAGLFNNDKCVISTEYEDIIYNDYNNCVILQKNSKQGLAKMDGTIILPIEYDNIFISGKYINTIKEGTSQIYNFQTLNKIEEPNIIALQETTNNNYAIAITSEEKYVIRDNKTNILKEQQYEYLEYIDNNVFIACLNGKFGIVDINGNIIINFKYQYLNNLQSIKLIQGCIQDNNTYEYFNYKGEKQEYKIKNELYPNQIKNFIKQDLGYGMPYYILQNNM